MHPVTPQATVVAIAARPGAGKSTVARHLAHRVTASCIVAYDDLQDVTRMSVDELVAWDVAGGDCNSFDLAALEEELERRRRSATSLVIFETPFGRRHGGTSRFIDRLVWLDTPSDIALARAVSKIITDHAREGIPAEETRCWLASYLGTYQKLLWHLYERQTDEVRSAADFIFSGMDSPHTIANSIVQHLQRCNVPLIVNDHPGIK